MYFPSGIASFDHAQETIQEISVEFAVMPVNQHIPYNRLLNFFRPRFFRLMISLKQNFESQMSWSYLIWHSHSYLRPENLRPFPSKKKIFHIFFPMIGNKGKRQTYIGNFPGLLVCPDGVYRNNWEPEFQKYPPHLRCPYYESIAIYLIGLLREVTLSKSQRERLNTGPMNTVIQQSSYLAGYWFVNPSFWDFWLARVSRPIFELRMSEYLETQRRFIDYRLSAIT